jgi:hypothetical protein
MTSKQNKLKLIHTTDGIKTVCLECGEEITSLMHKCNPFRDVKPEKDIFPYGTSMKDVKILEKELENEIWNRVWKDYEDCSSIDFEMELIKEAIKKGRKIERDEIVKEIKKWKYNKKGSFDKKTKSNYIRVSYKLFIKELLNFLGEKCGICDSNKHNTKEHTDKLMFKEKKNDNNTR